MVEEADGDLMGDGVNIAARLESICEHPARSASPTTPIVRSRGGSMSPSIDLGPTQLKNIADPIRVYSLDVGEPFQVRTEPVAPGSDRSVRAAPVDVVSPFANLGGDPEHDHFVDGVTESLTTDLSRIGAHSSSAGNTAFSYKGKADRSQARSGAS